MHEVPILLTKLLRPVFLDTDVAVVFLEIIKVRGNLAYHALGVVNKALYFPSTGTEDEALNVEAQMLPFLRS